MRSIAIALASAFLLAAPAPAAAQVTFTNEPWAVASRPVKINYRMPAGCDPSTSGAAATWNNTGARFQITDVGNYYQSEYINEQTNPDYNFINIQDASGLASTTPMQTISTSGYSGGRYVRTDANIYVNTNMLYYFDPGETQQSTDFYCASTVPAGGIGSQTDYQTAMVHEFGHAIGFGHRTDGNTGPCVMAASVPRGTIKRNPCTDERQRMLSVYGQR